MFVGNLKVALRNIARHKVFASINIVGLSVGMACCILIMLWVQNQISYDRFHENADNLCRVVLTNEQGDWHGYYTPGLLADFLKAEYPGIEEASVFRGMGPETKIGYGQTSLLRRGAFVDPSFLEMFSFPFILGDSKTAFSDPFGIVITEDLAKALFGNEDPIGQAVNFSDMVDLPVSGVLMNTPSNSHIRFDFLLSFEIAPQWLKVWDNKTLFTYVQLHDNSSAAAVSEKISEVYNDHNPGAHTKNYLYLQPVTETHLHNLESGRLGSQEKIVYVYILSAIAVVVLLIACINFMNLSTAISMTRAKEIGIRKAIGSGRVQLIGQFLTESILLSVLSLVLAIGLVELLLPHLNGVLDTRLRLEWTWDVIFGLAGVALITGMIAGSYPAFYLSSFRPVAILRGQHHLLPHSSMSRWPRKLAAGTSLRKVLVVTQFTLSIVLVVSVIVLSSQLSYVRNLDMGYDTERLVTFRLHGDLVRQAVAVKDELLRHSDIESIAFTLSKQLTWSESCGLDWEGKQPGDEFDIGINRVDYDYLKTFRMELSSGRFFSEEFPSDATEAFVINEAAAKAMGMEDPVGQRIYMPPLDKHGTIIGVLKDYHSESAHKEIRPFVLIPGRQFGYMHIRMRSANIRGTLDLIEETIRAFVPDDPVVYSFLDDDIAGLYRAEERTGELVTYMALLAVLISCLGLFGLASFSVDQRTKEIAVRKVHGASVTALVGLISREFVILVVVASLIAWPVSYYMMNRWLQSFAYRTPIWWWVFLLSGVIALALALITVSYRSVKAALANPVDSLRHE